VQQALRWMEGQHTFLHMERYADLTIHEDERSIALPTGFKKMLSWRILEESDSQTSSYFDIRKIDSYDISRLERKRPNAYWQDGKDYFWLDNVPDKDYETEMAYTAYTTLPSNTAETPYVIQNYETILLSKTVCLFGPQLRDTKVLTLYKDQMGDSMKAAIDADVEERQSWQSESVQYGYEFREQINAIGDATV
jgi:hypothetical protein